MYVDRLETPALIVEEKILYKNIEAMKSLLMGTDLQLRPHFKTHKCAALAHLQIKNGAKGMTCAKLSEAMDLCDSGIEDILIANQIVQPDKIVKLAKLAGDCRLTVCVDEEENIKALNRAAKFMGTTIHCLIEYDIGMQRCGVIDQNEVLRLAEIIGSQSNLVFDGIQAYAGHISHIEDLEERKQMTAANYKKLWDLLALLKEHGMPAMTLSGGSTGTAVIKAKEGLYTELQAGSYLFMDNTYKDLNLPFENSLFILATVISRNERLTVVDAGVKTCGVDQGMPGLVGYQAKEIVASEEHFQLHGLREKANIGDKIRLIPGHCCSTINLYDRIYLVDGNKVVDRISVTGRGYGK
ncbi:MAG: DSD1 family PLP-dependent enzyme [Clostridiales bacterium]|nr:DSD1 family PLP-dependent enzyme [Clostridiales bacterium]